MHVVIVGGSICGLMNGVVLKACGHHVQILEAREPRLLEEEAAGLSVGPDAQDLMKTIGLEISDYAITAPTLQIMDARGEVVREMAPAFSLVTSSWSTMFTKLKAEFLSPKAGLGNTHFRERARVTDVTYDGHKVEVVYEDTINRSKHTIAADLVIAADGSRSTIRSLVMPDVESEYAGYVAWRGDIPEATVPSTLKGLFEGKMAMSMAENSYILFCPTPGLGGSMRVGERVLDWTWYEYQAKDSPGFERVMTDSMGHLHRNTVPKGFLDDQVWRQQVERADTKLCKMFSDVVWKSGSPLVTAVTNVQSSKAAFFDGKLLLCGDAFTQLRPHLGLGCNLAALQATTLAKVLKGDMKMDDWERDIIGYATEFSYRSAAMGQFGLTGKFPDGYVPLSGSSVGQWATPPAT